MEAWALTLNKPEPDKEQSKWSIRIVAKVFICISNWRNLKSIKKGGRGPPGIFKSFVEHSFN